MCLSVYIFCSDGITFFFFFLKTDKEEGGGGVWLSFFWPEPLIFLWAQQELGRRPPHLPGVLVVCAYHLHTFLTGWRGLALIKGSSRVFPPRILLVPAAMNPYLQWWWWLLTVAHRHSRETRWRQGGQRDGRKGKSFSEGKTKENAKEGKKNLREDKWVLCVQLSPSLPPLLCISPSFWLLNQAPFCVKQLPLMTDLCWGWGSKLSTGSAVRHAMKLCKLSPHQPLSSLQLWLEKWFTSSRPKNDRISAKISWLSTIHKEGATMAERAWKNNNCWAAPRRGASTAKHSTVGH